MRLIHCRDRKLLLFMIGTGLFLLMRCMDASSVSCTVSNLYFKAWVLRFDTRFVPTEYDTNDRYESCSFSFQCPDESSCKFGNRTIKVSWRGSSYDLQIRYSDGANLISWDNTGISGFEQGAFEELRSIDELHFVLTNNKLSEIGSTHFRGLGNLEGLYLDHNDISILHPESFHGLINLQRLLLNDNVISVIHPQQFDGLNNLTLLALHVNRIVQISPRQFQGLIKLDYLDLSQNEISEIDLDQFIGMKTLRRLYLNNNKISEIYQEQFVAMLNLKLLRLNYNYISKMHPNLFNNISEKHPDQFISLTGLTSVRLQYNEISEIHPRQFTGLSNLGSLDLSYNNISEIHPGQFTGLWNIWGIFITHNSIQAIHKEQFMGLPPLSWLDLQHNKIRNIHHTAFSGAKSLSSLYLNDNEIEELHPRIFESLTLVSLHLHNNSLSAFTSIHFQFLNLEWFTIFRLSYNNLKTVALPTNKTYEYLEIIQLDQNKLTSFDFSFLSQTTTLKFLNLSKNSIKRLVSGFLLKAESLRAIDLIGNNLYEVNDKSFIGFTSYTIIQVDNEATCCFTQNATCLATIGKSQYLTCGRLLGNSVQRIFMWNFGLFTIFCNCGVFFYKIRNKEGNKVQRLFISSLSLSDLLMGIYMVMIASADTYYKNYFPSEAWRVSIPCKIAGVLSFLSSETSVFFVTLITIDRLMGIRFTFSKYRIGSTMSKMLVFISWAITLVLAVSATYITAINPDLYDVSEVCTGLPLSRKIVYEVQNYISLYVNIYSYFFYFDIPENVEIGRKPTMYFGIAVFTGLNLLCFLIVSISYIVIFFTTIQTANRSQRTRNFKNESKMAARMSAIVLTDLSCWLPIIILSILVQSGRFIVTSKVYTWIVTFVLPINSAINPFLYTLADALFAYVDKQKKRAQKSNASRIHVSSGSHR